MNYYLEYEAISLVEDAVELSLIKTLKDCDFCPMAPLYDFLDGAEDCKWEDHELDLTLLSKTFPEYEFILTIVGEHVVTKSFIDGRKIGEFNGGLLKQYGKLRFVDDVAYAIPDYLIERFDLLRKKGELEQFEEYIVDPQEIRVVCPI